MNKKWIRYRFKTRAVEDSRPVKWPMPGPYWESGFAGDGSYAVMIAYLPVRFRLRTFWPDAFAVEKERCDSIEFTSRFPRPHWWKP